MRIRDLIGWIIIGGFIVYLILKIIGIIRTLTSDQELLWLVFGIFYKLGTIEIRLDHVEDRLGIGRKIRKTRRYPEGF